MAALASTWVDATPFRAHLRFLMAVGSLSVADVAALAGISSAAASHLLNGRGGRTVRRVSPEMARRLISVSASEVRGLRWRLMPADKARSQLSRLRRAGHTDAEIADLARLSMVELATLAHSQHCSELVTVRLIATARTQDAERMARGRSAVLPAAA